MDHGDNQAAAHRRREWPGATYVCVAPYRPRRIAVADHPNRCRFPLRGCHTHPTIPPFTVYPSAK